MTPLAWGMLVLLMPIVLSGLDTMLGLRLLENLADIPPLAGRGPVLSLIVAARNEERGVIAGARSLLAQSYSDIEFLVVEDRSTDHTGRLLDQLAAAEPKLRVVHLTELPPGWLGKNHALHLGAKAARGEYLLFTDADIVMHPETVARAMEYVRRHDLDHLTILPELRLPGFLLQTFQAGFAVLLPSVLRPWKARDPRSPHYIGVGAFNLIKASTYRSLGGHEPIRLRPDDDLMLGKLLKRNGARQDALKGEGMVSVEWYSSLRELVDGLAKNTFAVVNYHTGLMILTVVFTLLVGLGPLIALALGSGALRVIGGSGVVFQLLLFFNSAREVRVPFWTGLLYPIVYLLVAWIMVRSAVLNLWQGGIYWRGTFYPLSELRKNRV